MPLYTVYHPPALTETQRAEIAEGITKAHVEVTNAPAFLVKVIFIPLESTSFFTAGKPESSLLRIVGVIRAGRAWDDRQSLLLTIYDALKGYGYDVEAHLEEMKAEVCPIWSWVIDFTRISLSMDFLCLRRIPRKKPSGKRRACLLKLLQKKRTLKVNDIKSGKRNNEDKNRW